MPTPEAERLFLESFTTTREHFRQSLDALKRGAPASRQYRLRHGATDKAGRILLADDTYDELLGKLADRAFANVSEGLRSNLVAFYGDVDSLPAGTNAERKPSAKIRRQLAVLESVKTP